ncbi:hypothetical protein KDA_74670 [Dictyobacter alpinus]|uniref:Uncharacterized protein n=1 Tax=Dictyobacter alpinus TaxID=2014873 RepID=A0A402BKT4_9CHLR|nr:hypothetical protein [Dictyobacter alpinus]GCE31983.1 hypothetical protein KDA_74670 [Dictyobacter alpinus]
MNSHGDHTQVQGRAWSEHEYMLSFFISMQVGAVWGHCYENAYPLFFAIPELFDPHGLFIEGWIVFEDTDRVVLMEHGWLLSRQQYIVDPTIVLAVEISQPVYYYPGVSRARAELEALENEFFPHVRFSGYRDDGMQHAGYLAAYESALQKARSMLSEKKTFVEVKATLLPSQDEVVSQSSDFGVIVVQRNGGGPHGQERG